MEYRTLGRTDVRVSSICLGSMTWGQQNSQSEAFAQLDHARAAGVNFVDAAELYPIPPRAETQGRTEEHIGAWLADRGLRGDMVIGTKVTGRTDSEWLNDHGKGSRLSRAGILHACEQSLKRLKTDYIDIYQVHWPDRALSQFGANPMRFESPDPHEDEISIQETLSALGELVDAGKVRYVGLSNESAWGTMRYLFESETRGLPRVQSIQNAYSLANRTFETALAEVAERENVGLLAYSALAQGYLTGKYRDGALPEGSRKALFNRLWRYEKPGADIAFNAYLDLAARHGLDPAQMALSFALSRPFVTSVIIGATTLEQLSTDLAAADLALSDELRSEIEDIHRMHANPCP